MSIQTYKLHTHFLLLNACPEWLELSPEQQNELIQNELGEIAANHPGVTIRLYQNEADNPAYTDIFMVEGESIEDTSAMLEEWQRTRLISHPYFQILEDIRGQEYSVLQFDSNYTHQDA